MKREEFLKYLTMLPLAGQSMELKAFGQIADSLPKSKKMPVLFSSHGNPMEMIAPLHSTPFFKTLGKLSAEIRKEHTINAVLIISAHWNTRGTYVNISKSPETVYDFSGFPEDFYKVKYKAPGSPELGKEIAKTLKASETTEWGYDHGSWPILRQLFPEANIPVVQMSIDYNQPAKYHFELAGLLKSLRERGVLIIGSGNIVHNLPLAARKIFKNDRTPYGWDVEFDNYVKEKLEKRDFQSLIDYEKTSLGRMAAPTPDHYVPMLYSLGLVSKDEPLVTTYEDVYAAYSERSFKIG